MSISEDKSEENNISNPNINNMEEPKNIPEQISAVADPSTEIGSKFFIYKNIAGINEFTGTETFINNNSHSDNTYRLNSTINHYLSYLENPQTHFFIDEDESAPVDINQESALFDIDDYYNYNDILSSYFSRQFGRQLTFDNLNEKINSLITGEK